MKIVIDTNVLGIGSDPGPVARAGAVLVPGQCPVGMAGDARRDGRIYRGDSASEVRPARSDSNLVAGTVNSGYPHTILPEVEIDFPRDRKDAAFLICAQSGKADYLITGDGDFSEAQALIQTSIVSVAQFARAVAPELLSG